MCGGSHIDSLQTESKRKKQQQAQKIQAISVLPYYC